MNKQTITRLVVILVAVGLAAAVSFAADNSGVRIVGLPLLVFCALMAFAINWLAFIPAYKAQTEHFYDLTGSLTYLSVIVFAVSSSSALDTRGLLAAALVVVWALRLGAFLFTRIQRDGKDDRFDEIKPDSMRFFTAWTLQGLWVVLTAVCALVIISDAQRVPMDVFGVAGLLIWVFGFAIEVTADAQKSAFKKNSKNSGKFISTGLWAWSRHPNYFGEITLWVGMAIIAMPLLQGAQWVALVSPLFVFSLIRYVSGVNTLESKAQKKWGDDPDYQVYRDSTPILMMKPPR